MNTNSETAEAKDRLINVGVWLWNVCSAVTCIFAVKQLMRPIEKGGYGFSFSISLAAMHYATCSIFTYFYRRRQEASQPPKNKDRPQVKLPLAELIFLVGINDLSIMFLTMSLLLNPVFTYQIAKLLIVPFVAIIEYCCYGNPLTHMKVTGITIVLAGIFLVVNPSSAVGSDVVPSVTGIVVAVASFVAAGAQQISTRVLQKKYSVAPVDLLDSIAWVMALSIGLVGPLVDYSISGQWVWNYQWSWPAFGLLALSCFLAVSINLSQIIFLGRLSATTYQVVGHVKTILVLVGGVVVFSERVAALQWAGVALTIGGIVVYTLKYNNPVPQLPQIRVGTTNAAKLLQISSSPSGKQANLSLGGTGLRGGYSYCLSAPGSSKFLNIPLSGDGSSDGDSAPGSRGMMREEDVGAFKTTPTKPVNRGGVLRGDETCGQDGCVRA